MDNMTVLEIHSQAISAIENVENMLVECDGFRPVEEWLVEVEDLLEYLEEVYGAVEEGADLIEAWDNVESEGGEFYDAVNEIEMPDLSFLEVDEDEIDNRQLYKFIEAYHDDVEGLVRKVNQLLAAAAEKVYHDYDFAVHGRS